MKTLSLSLLLVLTLISTGLATPSNDLSAENLSDLARARKATARFHSVEQAEAEGYINLNFCEGVQPGFGCTIRMECSSNTTLVLSEPQMNADEYTDRSARSVCIRG